MVEDSYYVPWENIFILTKIKFSCLKELKEY